MDTSNEPRLVIARKGTASSPPKASPSHSTPTTFFLKSEKELEKRLHQRGRKTSRSSATEEDMASTPVRSSMGDSSFGVQSLEETIQSTFLSDSNPLTRTASNSSEYSSPTGDPELGASEGGVILSRTRRAGNRVHPTIIATGNRIISSERPASSGAVASPVSASQSPLRRSIRRRGSGRMDNDPLTPIRLSPYPGSVTPSTPRSGSPKSFRLSDEDSADETSSQAVMSSSGDDEHDSQIQHQQQLVMPSLAVPLRRPFTEQGKRIGRAKIMVLGAKGTGKSSFISSLYRSEHIVHMDWPSTTLASTTVPSDNGNTASSAMTEIHASTRPYPPWWTDVEGRRTLPRRKSVVEGALERNLTFVDTPALDEDQVHATMNHVKMTLRRTANMESMSGSELVSLLSGNGGVQIDAAVYLFDSAPSQSSDPAHFGLSAAHQELLQCLCKWTNLIPVITHSDAVTPATLERRKQQVSHMFEHIAAEPYRLTTLADRNANEVVEPLAVSFALGEDSEIDASVLMSSQYLQPLIPSELDRLIRGLLAPDNISRMRHLSAAKFLLWRQEQLGARIDGHEQAALHSPFLRSQSPGVTSTGSLFEEPSKVLVPHSTSSWFRSASPATSDISSRDVEISSSALAHLSQHAQPSEPFRQVRLAKWAQDLQRSLANERKKYTQLYNPRPYDWSSDDEKQHARALVPRDALRPGRGRLGGDLGVIDPRDPLGVLAFGHAFGRRGFLVLQIVGSCGLLGAVAYWIMRDWADVQALFAAGNPHAATTPVMIHAHAVPPPPARPILGWIDENCLGGVFGWK